MSTPSGARCHIEMILSSYKIPASWTEPQRCQFQQRRASFMALDDFDKSIIDGMVGDLRDALHERAQHTGKCVMVPGELGLFEIIAATAEFVAMRGKVK